MKIFYLLLILFLGLQVSAQEKLKEKFIQYTSIEREHISVNLNKDVFKNNETLWFTAYLTTIFPNIQVDESLNLHVRLYNDKGLLVNTSVYNIEYGVASGSLLLNQPPGTYFLKVQTNWMLNFPESKPFIKKINIVNNIYDSIDTSNKIEVIQEHNLPIKYSSDISMIVNTLAPKDLIISFQKINSYKEDNFKLVIHNNKSINISNCKIKGNTKVLKIPKKQLSKGIHTILLLDSKNNVLQERVIYHQEDFKVDSPFLTHIIKQENDSIHLALKNNSKYSQNQITSLHIRSLDFQKSKTFQNIEIQNTFKNIWIKNKENLFIPTNKKSLAQLNENLAFAKNVLQFENIINKEIITNYNRERGYTISGNVEKWNNSINGSVSFYQRNNGHLQNTVIQKDGSFVFKNIYIEKGEQLNFSVIKNGKNVSEPQIDIDIQPQLKKDSLTIKRIELTQENDTISSINISNIFTTEEGINLKEVKLTTKKKKANLSRNKSFANNSFIDSEKISVDIIKKTPMLSSYIRKLGFNVIRNPQKTGKLLIRSNNPIKAPPILFIDDIMISNSELNEQPLSSIDEIYYDSGSVSGNSKGAIYIYRKYDGFVGSEITAVASIASSNGFEKQQIFFNESLSDTFDAFSQKHGTIYWDDTTSLTEKENIIAFPRYALNGIQITIDSIDSQGTFFSMTEEIIFDD